MQTKAETAVKTAVKTWRFELRVTAGFLKSIDEWRGRQDDIPSRAEAARRLVRMGLDAGVDTTGLVV